MTTPPPGELTRTARLARVLAVIAAVLAFSAVILRWLREREFDWVAASGGMLMLAMAFSAGRKKP